MGTSRVVSTTAGEVPAPPHGQRADAEDLSWTDFVNITTTQVDFHVPPTVRRIDAAWVLEEFTLPAMLQEAVSALGVYGEADTRADQSPRVDEELSMALASLGLEPAEAPSKEARAPEGNEATAAPTEDAGVEEPRFVVIPRVTRGMARQAAPHRRNRRTPHRPPIARGVVEPPGLRRQGRYRPVARPTPTPELTPSPTPGLTPPPPPPPPPLSPPDPTLSTPAPTASPLPSPAWTTTPAPVVMHGSNTPLLPPEERS